MRPPGRIGTRDLDSVERKIRSPCGSGCPPPPPTPATLYLGAQCTSLPASVTGKYLPSKFSLPGATPLD